MRSTAAHGCASQRRPSFVAARCDGSSWARRRSRARSTPQGRRRGERLGAAVRRPRQRAGLPVPLSQRRHELAGVGVARVDFEFATFGIVVEVAGRRGYLSRDEREQKERRRTALQLAGQTVYQFTTHDILNDPDDVIGTLFLALSRAG
jgi:hypothetical protein